MKHNEALEEIARIEAEIKEREIHLVRLRLIAFPVGSVISFQKGQNTLNGRIHGHSSCARYLKVTTRTGASHEASIGPYSCNHVKLIP